ncbi:MAG: PHP-associated domain-containing protein [Candidatus Woesearchaeota archaeon]
MKDLSHMRALAKADQKRVQIKRLIKKGYTLCDMHVHTRFSDSYTRVRRLLKKAEKKGIGLAITDHNEIGGVLRAYELGTNVMVIPGIEVSSAEGPHILVYFSKVEELTEFYKRHVEPAKNKNPHTNTKLSIPELLQVAQAYDSVVSIAHPYSPAYTHVPKGIKKGYILPDMLKSVHAVEVINGAMTKGMNNKAMEFADELSCGITGGSDSHSLFEFGKVVTYANAGTIPEFLDCIKNKQSFVRGAPVNQLQRMPSIAKSGQKHMPYLVPSLGQRYEQIVVRPMRYHKPMIVNKLTVISNESKQVIRNPLPAAKLIYKPLGVVVKKFNNGK